jgi:Transmembrane amino acid transporter protein
MSVTLSTSQEFNSCLPNVTFGFAFQIPSSNGLLTALFVFHTNDLPHWVLGLTIFLVIINCLASFQIYAMPVFDQMEAGYVEKHNKPCPQWRRTVYRILFAAIAFLIGVAFPFLSNLGALIGGIALPITLAYPSFMWISVTKTKSNQKTASWYLNWFLGSLGMGLSVVLTIGALWSLIKQGVDLHFFKAAT